MKLPLKILKPPQPFWEIRKGIVHPTQPQLSSDRVRPAPHPFALSRPNGDQRLGSCGPIGPADRPSHVSRPILDRRSKLSQSSPFTGSPGPPAVCLLPPGHARAAPCATPVCIRLPRTRLYGDASHERPCPAPVTPPACAWRSGRAHPTPLLCRTCPSPLAVASATSSAPCALAFPPTATSLPILFPGLKSPWSPLVPPLLHLPATPSASSQVLSNARMPFRLGRAASKLSGSSGHP